jgi:hypothetical protein
MDELIALAKNEQDWMHARHLPFIDGQERLFTPIVTAARYAAKRRSV